MMKNYRLKRSDFSVGDTCYVLVKCLFGRRLADPVSYRCRVVGIGKKYIVVEDVESGNTYSFNMSDDFKYRDPIYGPNRDAELFHNSQELYEREEGEQLNDVLCDKFSLHNFVSEFNQGHNMIKQYRLVNAILNSDVGPELTEFLSECIVARNNSRKTAEEVVKYLLSQEENSESEEEYETYENYFCYDESGSCVTDGFETLDSAVLFAKENGYHHVDLHRYYRDSSRGGKTYPDGDPETVWTSNNA